MENQQLIIQVAMICGATGLAGLVGGLCGFLYDVERGNRSFTLLSSFSSIIIGSSIGAFSGSVFHEYNIFGLLAGCYFAGLNSYRLIEVMRDKMGFLAEKLIEKFTK